MNPHFADAEVIDVPATMKDLLPHQGSYEIQNDQPGKLHSWHRHNLPEELYILSGEALLFWAGDGEEHHRRCPAGTWITLPAGLTHGSIAGKTGCGYMIRPENCRTAETVFLAEGEAPYPIPACDNA